LRQNNPGYREREAGFTLIEAAAAVGLLSLLSLVGFASLSRAGDATMRLIGDSLTVGRLFEAEALFLREASRIREPFWAPDSAASIGKDSALVAYYGGDPGAFLSVICSDGYVVLASPQGRWRLGPFESASLSPVENSAGAGIGMKIDLSVGGKAVALTAVFSSIPLRCEDK
jgi:hypothetical protein